MARSKSKTAHAVNEWIFWKASNVNEWKWKWWPNKPRHASCKNCKGATPAEVGMHEDVVSHRIIIDEILRILF